MALEEAALSTTFHHYTLYLWTCRNLISCDKACTSQGQVIGTLTMTQAIRVWERLDGSTVVDTIEPTSFRRLPIHLLRTDSLSLTYDAVGFEEDHVRLVLDVFVVSLQHDSL